MADMYVIHIYKLTSLDRGLLEVKQKTRSYLKITISTHHQATSFFWCTLMQDIEEQVPIRL